MSNFWRWRIIDNRDDVLRHSVAKCRAGESSKRGLSVEHVAGSVGGQMLDDRE